MVVLAVPVEGEPFLPEETKLEKWNEPRFMRSSVGLWRSLLMRMWC